MMIIKCKLISIGSHIYPLDHFFYLYQIKTGQKLSRMRHIWPVDRQLLNKWKFYHSSLSPVS